MLEEYYLSKLDVNYTKIKDKFVHDIPANRTATIKDVNIYLIEKGIILSKKEMDMVLIKSFEAFASFLHLSNKFKKSQLWDFDFNFIFNDIITEIVSKEDMYRLENIFNILSSYYLRMKNIGKEYFLISKTHYYEDIYNNLLDEINEIGLEGISKICTIDIFELLTDTETNRILFNIVTSFKPKEEVLKILQNPNNVYYNEKIIETLTIEHLNNVIFYENLPF